MIRERVEVLAEDKKEKIKLLGTKDGGLYTKLIIYSGDSTLSIVHMEDPITVLMKHVDISIVNSSEKGFYQGKDIVFRDAQ